MYNEIFPPIIEKNKIMEANERSLFQLLELFSKDGNKPHVVIDARQNLMQHFYLKHVFLCILKN